MYKKIFLTFFIIFISIILGNNYNHKYLSTIILCTGLLNIWFAILNKNYNYLFGGLFYIFNAYISYINGLYGIALLSIFLYFPLQIDGFLRWKKDTSIKSLSKNNLLFLLICIVTTTIGFTILLFMIPSQSLAILDASSNITNICGIILMNLKYREAWHIWCINNVIDLIIWITNSILNKPFAHIMLIVSIGYIGMNVYGLRTWKKLET